MEQKQLFNCYVIGNDSLTIHCASVLLEKKHHLLGIISTSPQIKSWCQKHQINLIKSIYEFEKQHPESCDYLFSIVNDAILPESIIQFPRVCAINYHNSPLPKYAGLYASSWAILNKETEHAISWHIIESEVDAGDIVKQCFFPIDESDTALTLNLKCYEAAIESFGFLVDELASNTERRVPQNLDLRTYYGLKNKPKNLGFVSWDWEAEEIDRLCRALSFGAYRNELATPKLIINEQLYLITAYRKLHIASKKPPGTIVHLSKNELQITTQTLDFALFKIMDTDGVLYDMEQWSTRCSLSVGQVLPNFNEQIINQLANHGAVCLPKTERFWVKKYSQYIHQDLSFMAHLTQAATPDSGRRSSLVLPKHLSNQLQHYSSVTKTSPYYVLCTVVLIYLYRLNDYKNYSIQISDSSLHYQLGELSCYLSDTLPFTTDLTHDIPFGDMAIQITQQVLRLKEHDTFCKDLFVRYPELRSPKKDVLIRFIDEQEATIDSEGNYKLIVFISKDGTGLHIHNHTNYQDNEASYAFFNRIEEHLCHLLEDALTHPEKHLFELMLLSEEELCLMEVWNKTSYDYDATKLLHHYIEQQVSKTPTAIAACFEETTINYELLNKKANQLAHYLIQQGVQQNDIVGLYIHRSLEMLISILAILKAGAAYLPLDPHYPEKRIHYMLENSHAKCLIIDEQPLPHPFKGSVIDITDFAYEAMEFTVPETKTSATDLAYIIYTSGTTGTPKGVAISHRAACNHMLWMKEFYDFEQEDRFLLKTPFSFDASVWEIFMPLIMGSLLVIAPNEAHTNPKELIDLITHHQITIIQLVPSMLREMTLTQGFGDCSSLRHVFCGGEALLPETLHGFFEHNTFNAQLHNLYGPTEATIDAVTRTCSIEDSERPLSLIGKPIFNTKAYILDRFMQILPAGAIGELYLSGDGLAQGYLNNPNLSQKKFLPHPFHPNERVYKTGDLVTWQNDGSIEYHGRADEQIKIRGFRIEISEIESCLEKIHCVYQCMVIPEKSQEGYLYLSAYLVLQEHTQLSATELRAALKKELPDYMIPSRFYLVDHLLSTPNGKLDRTHTPVPIKQLSLATKQLPPANDTQKCVHQIWCSVLHKESLSIDDDFFEQGGHSLLAIQIITRVQERLSIKLTIRTLFEYPTIQSLSNEVDRLANKNSDFELKNQFIPCIIPLKKSGHKLPVFLIHPVGGGIFWYTALGKYFDKDRPLYAIQDPALESQSFLFDTLEAMAAHYIEHIKHIQPQSPYIIGGASFGATVAIEMAHQLQNKSDEVLAIISLDGWAEYPSLQSSETYFKEMMKEQNARLLEHYEKNKVRNASFLLEMQWHREKMLMNYSIPKIKAPLLLFKAAHLSPLFQYDASLNWWDGYTDKPIECHLVPGDHESMFYDKNSKVLAELICNSLMDK